MSPQPPPPDEGPSSQFFADFLSRPLSPEALAGVAGRASPATKAVVLRSLELFAIGDGPASWLFCATVARRMRITEVDVRAKDAEQDRLEACVVCEVDVEADMLNRYAKMHGSCSMYPIDICSALALNALSAAQRGTGDASVSHTLHTVFHSPASHGDKLKIVNTTLALGARVMSAQTEIWNATHHRLVASGLHTKMFPSAPKAKM